MMTARTIAAGSVAVALATAVTVSCSRPSTPQEQFSLLFDGYELLDSRPLPQTNNAEAVFPLEVKRGQAFDRQWRPGRYYVFDKRTTEDNDRMALKVFPARLRQIGGTIIRAPRSHEDMIILVWGGPLFRIEFTSGERRGVILNRIGKIDSEPAELLMFFYT